MMYVYVSSTVKAAAQEFGLTKRIEEVKERLEADPSLLTPIFENRFPCWIKKMENFRLIAAKPRSFGEDQILYLADVLKRGDTAYNPDFLDDPEKWEAKQNIDWKGVHKWLEERKNHEEQEQHQRKTQPHLPHYLEPWLKRPIFIQGQDVVVYESEHWVNSFRSEIQNNENEVKKLECFYQLTYQIIFEGKSGYNTSFTNVQTLADSKTEHTILFSRIRTCDPSKRNIVFLIAALKHKPKPQEIKKIGEVLHLFGDKTIYQQNGLTTRLNILAKRKITTNEIARYSRRAYPGEFAAFFEYWQRIELDGHINMAMSAEEEKLLHEIQFPAFINGRAGSGKSTMLHYAFAHYCEEYLKKVRDGNLDSGKKQELRPLFLTYSNSLLAKAQETVILILSSHHKYSEGTLQTN